MDIEPLVFVGIDWASTEHQVCLMGADSPVQRTFAHDADGIGAMVDWLVAQAEQPGQVFVAIETPHGPIVEALMDRGIAVFSINPKQLDRFRDRFSPAGAKDDRRDALVLASSLRTDRHCFRRVEALDPVVVELREWSRMAEELKQERVRLANRVRQQLWRYYPQMLDLTDDVGADWLLALWTKVPTPSEATRLTEAKIARVLAAHRIRRITAADALAILRRPALTVAPGTADAARAHITAVAERLNLVNRQIKTVTRRIDGLIEQLAGPETEPGQDTEQRDATILRSLPGVGRIVLATLLAEAHQAIQARDYHALRTLTGVAPVAACEPPFITGRASLPSTTPAVAAATQHSERVATLTAAPSEPLPIVCWVSRASCSPTEPCSIPKNCPPIAQNHLDHWWGVPPHATSSIWWSGIVQSAHKQDRATAIGTDDV
jgi:endonuclease III